MTEISQIGEVTAAADWWSVGALLYEIITGQVSFNSLVIFGISISSERKGWLNCSSCSVLFPSSIKKNTSYCGRRWVCTFFRFKFLFNKAEFS